MIKAIIFDLDNCILDNRTLPRGVVDSVTEPLYSSNLPEEQKKKIRVAMSSNAFEHVVKEHGIPDPVANSMREAYRQLELHPSTILKTYGDEDVIKSLPTKNILITSGYRKFQQSKIDLLNIEKLFAYTMIDINDKPGEWKGKERIFKEILEQEGWSASEVLVVGDNPKSELSAAKALGITAIQTLRPGVEKWEGADAHITSLYELKDFI